MINVQRSARQSSVRDSNNRSLEKSQEDNISVHKSQELRLRSWTQRNKELMEAEEKENSTHETGNLLHVSTKAKRAASASIDRSDMRDRTNDAESMYLDESQSSAYNSRRFLHSSGHSSDQLRDKQIDTLYDDVIKKAGGFGLYQLAMTVSMILGNNGPGLVVYGIAYFELEPTYICHYSSPPDPSDPDDDSNGMQF